MSSEKDDRQIARRIATAIEPEQKDALQAWILDMLSIRQSNLPALDKARQALSRTASREVLFPAIRAIAAAVLPNEMREMGDKLQEIRRGSGSLPSKTLAASKLVASALKQIAWDERGLKARLALSGAVAGVVLFGGQGAGIAALGTAIGVPLWVVFGAGAAFIGALYEELTGRKPPKTTYRVIDAEPEPKRPSDTER